MFSNFFDWKTTKNSLWSQKGIEQNQICIAFKSKLALVHLNCFVQ